MSYPSVTALPFPKRAFFLGLAGVAALTLVGCNLLRKGDGADAAADAPAVATPPQAAAPTPAPADPAAANPAAQAPLAAGAVAPTPGAPRIGVVDAGAKAVDAGTAVADAGRAVPAPTPTFQIPTAIPGFDAGAFKPPAGFPTAIPTTIPTIPKAK